MAAGEEKSNDFYAVLGLKKECTASELRNAYKRLAMRWHPDRCSASGNSKFVEESKKKFQAIQEAYSVLSDANKRFLYDVGVYDSDDDENGMGEFLNEMAVMMSQTKSNENGEESFEELQELFVEMFQRDASASHHPMNSFSSSSSNSSCCESSNANNKRNSAEMSSGRMMNTGGESSAFDAHFQTFCFGQPGEIPGGGKEQEEEFPEKPAVDVNVDGDGDGGEEEPKAKGFIYLAMLMSSDPYHSMATETGQGMGLWDRGKQRTMKSRVLCFCPVKNLQLHLPNFASLPQSASFIFQK